MLSAVRSSAALARMAPLRLSAQAAAAAAGPRLGAVSALAVGPTPSTPAVDAMPARQFSLLAAGRGFAAPLGQMAVGSAARQPASVMAGLLGQQPHPLALVGPAAGPMMVSRGLMMPRRSKFRKRFKGRVYGRASRGHYVAFGKYGLQVQHPVRLTAAQIESARRAITRRLKRVGRMWIRIFPDIQVSKKPAEVRMGSGKGSVDHWVVRLKANRVIFELDQVPEPLARAAFRLAASKLPIPCKFVLNPKLVRGPPPTAPAAEADAGAPAADGTGTTPPSAPAA
ncbi:hypothetical protein H696_02507 [Fonticula alba]|uniref:Uncharacterized protein n=1 Tax=Fonticula alba TaxID=691883 RepID=A0A058ZDM4_FONAL|nr:hypothetical protein H696_02507 [Fonticula alba]KCV71567.1 hypothetical protein H696_02507 [Fonticula alba]|eukprot:XP_009494690.1 hypothetical protein H696_02507 [Fonticula alba]